MNELRHVMAMLPGGYGVEVLFNEGKQVVAPVADFHIDNEHATLYLEIIN